MQSGDKFYFADRERTLEVRSDGRMFATWLDGAGTVQRFEVSADQLSASAPEAVAAQPDPQPEAQPEPSKEPEEVEPEHIMPEPESTPDPEPFI